MSEQYEYRGSTIARMRLVDDPKTDYVEILTDEGDLFVVDRVLSKIEGGMASLYVEELPELRTAEPGVWFTPTRG